MNFPDMNFTVISPLYGRYEMTEDRGRRKTPRRAKAAEDAILNQRRRDIAGSSAYDLERNNVIVNWAFNKYLDYTTVAYFCSMTGDSGLDDEIEHIFSEWQLAENCDIARRNDFDTMIRIFGSALSLDGDAAFLKIGGGRLQGLETDRIRSGAPGQPMALRSTNGVIVNESTGAADGYIVCDRGEGGRGYRFNRIVRPDEIIFRGNFKRFDQVRGIPFIVPAVNKFIDIGEIDEYQLLKVKNHATMGLAVYSENGSGLNSFGPPLLSSNAGGSGSSGEDDAETVAPGIYPYDLTAPALKFELEPGDKIEMLESHTPSNEYQSFSEMQIRQALLVFGLAFSFFDSRSSSYSAMKQDRAEFRFFVQRFQRMMLNVRNEVTRWVLPSLLLRNGIRREVRDLKFEWIPQAEPWLDEKNEVSASTERMATGLSSPQREARRRGLDAIDVLRETARYQNYVRASQVVVSVGAPGARLFNENTLNSTENKKNTDEKNLTEVENE